MLRREAERRPDRLLSVLTRQMAEQPLRREAAEGLGLLPREAAEGLRVLSREAAEGLALLPQEAAEGLGLLPQEAAEGLGVLPQEAAEGLGMVSVELTEESLEQELRGHEIWLTVVGRRIQHHVKAPFRCRCG